MIPYNLGEKAIYELFMKVRIDSVKNEFEEFQKYRDFYENDWEMIQDHIKDAMLNSYYSKNTVDKLRIRHKDMIQKILNRKASGIFENDPKRYIKDKEDENLSEILDPTNYNQEIHEAYRRSLFFNTVLVHPLVRGGKLQYDILTHDECDVVADENDYLVPKEVYIRRANPQTGEVYVVFWSKEDHYIIDGDGNKKREIERDGETITLGNDSGILPFATLRIKKGTDFWGEPNNNLLYSQIESDISRTNFKFAEEFQSFGVWVGINLGDDKNIELSPNKMIEINGVRQTDFAVPSLNNVVPQINWTSLRENQDWEYKQTVMSEGLSANTAEVDTTAQAGVSKRMDEGELEEFRERSRVILYDFEKELLSVVREVYNSADIFGSEIPEGDFQIEYSEEKQFETVSDKKIRREEEIKYYINTPVDIIMEEKGIGRGEAEKRYADNKEEMQNLGGQTSFFNQVRSQRNGSAE